ncbi:MAG: hypothetical protein VX642_00520 [Bdellovibrionota bacterium]|nr:hypothetical protein [Bdellovibrionota bacterium]
MTKVQSKCYCAFCKNERKVNLKRHISFMEIFTGLVLSTLFSFIFWQSFRPEAIAFFVVCLIMMELGTHFKFRLGIICPYCGFDPILYRRNPQAACQKVSGFMEQRRKDPMFYLSNKGYDKLARRKIELEEKKEALSEALKPSSPATIGALGSLDSPSLNEQENSLLENQDVKQLPPF